MTERYIVELQKIDIINELNCRKDVVGGKAYGLLMMPSSWTPTFFIISKNLYKNYIECDESSKKERLINSYMRSIKKCMDKLHLKNSTLIIRSSGLKEGMNERGKFESYQCSYSDFKDRLVELIEDIHAKCEVPGNEMPFVVQEYIYGTITGHLSNEYRFSKEIRDWKFQTECNGDVSALTSLGVRNWRQKIDTHIVAENPLKSNSMTYALRLLASYYTDKQLRRHIEFVYDEETLYAVQADEDIDEDSTVNPTQYDITMTSEDGLYDFKIMRYTTENDEKKYNKIRNVAVYHSAGIKTVPLYILDDYNTISNLANDIFSQDLEHDLTILLKRSIVIRSDITPYKKENAQLLQRSNELKNIDEVKKWLFENSKKILEQKGVFIFHNFVPAISAAFAYAKPGVRKVEIQSLWGLPEGLYYNAHDRIIVDTKFLDVDYLDANKINDKDIKKMLEYKPTCILPENTGEWKLKKIARPYNWKCSIRDNESIKQIAIESRKIAEKEKEAISIMWFVEIDENYYKTKNIPWHHEKCTLETYTSDSYKRKYFSDEEITIKNEKDLEKLNDNSYIKCIRIQPDNDCTLRDKDFIENVGEVALKYNLTILLEGAVLAHSFYQLRNTGANVVVANNFSEYAEEIEFNKLVRDKIPQNIISGGENAQCAIADDNLYLYLLMNKLIEESYEAYDSNNEELLYELVDIYQVCDSIVNFHAQNLWLIPRSNDVHKKKQGVNFKFNHYLASKEYQIFSDNDFLYSIALSRKNQIYEAEIRIWHKNDKANVSNHLDKYEKNHLTSLIDISTNMLWLSNLSLIKDQACMVMDKIQYEILTQLQIDENKFFSACKKKATKNGLFKNKYVLLKTRFSGENMQNEEVTLPVIRSLSQKNERSIELLKSGDTNTLLIRKKISMEHIKYTEVFSNEKISSFFGKSSCINLSFEHKNDTILLNISRENIKEYVQLEF